MLQSHLLRKKILLRKGVMIKLSRNRHNELVTTRLQLSVMAPSAQVVTTTRLLVLMKAEDRPSPKFMKIRSLREVYADPAGYGNHLNG
nr:hypothetical protein BaRGS_004143 [Batillaria attramentaria]